MINLNQDKLNELHDNETKAISKLTINDKVELNKIIEEYYRNTSNLQLNK